MKNLFALVLILNLNLYTMERDSKEYGPYRHCNQQPQKDTEKKELYNLMNKAAKDAIRKEAEEKELREQGDCSAGLGTLASASVSVTIAIITYLLNNQ